MALLFIPFLDDEMEAVYAGRPDGSGKSSAAKINSLHRWALGQVGGRRFVASHSPAAASVMWRDAWFMVAVGIEPGAMYSLYANSR